MSVEKIAQSDLTLYKAEDIAKRLAAFKSKKIDTAQENLLQRCQVAASVLVTVDPEHLITEVPPDVDLIELLGLVPAVNETQPNVVAKSLPQSARKRTLRQLYTAEAMQQALNSHDSIPDTLLQRTFVKAIELEVFDQERMSAEELSALATVSGWLEGTEPGEKLPTPDALQSTIEKQQEESTLKRMAGEHFVGRADELALIRSFVENGTASILTISGEGGAGKTALVSRAILDWIHGSEGKTVGNYWIRVDLDYSMVRPDQPETVMTEIARRIGRAMPSHAAEEASRFIDLSSRFERISAYSVDSSSRSGLSYEDLLSEFRQFLVNVSSLVKVRRLIVWFDTFEEAQFLGDAVVDGMIDMAVDMCRSRQVRIIISRRPPIRDVSNRKLRSSTIQLSDLDRRASEALLDRLVASNVPRKLLSTIVGKVGGNPLTLRLVANLLRNEGKIDSAVLADVANEALQQRLYSRILAHIHDDDVQKLAIPGIVVRRITTGVIQNVLAKPCGLGQLDDLRAKRILEVLGEERTLVETESPGVLHFRQDLRMVMLAGLSDQHKEMLKQIDQAAVDYWSSQTGPIAAAEAIYHRLRLKQAPDVLDRFWSPQAAPLLRSTLEELPAKSTQRLWLASKLRAVVDHEERGTADLREWEEQAFLQASRLLVNNRANKVLEVLSERSERLPNSRLYAIESRAWLALNNEKKAARVAADGIEALKSHSSKEACELALVLAFAEQRQGRLEKAMEAAKQALQFSDVSWDTDLQLQSLLRVLRLTRLMHLPVDKRVAGKVRRVLVKLPHVYNLSLRPDTLRDMAAEVGDIDTEWLMICTGVLLKSLLETTAQAEVLRLMVDFKLVSSTDEWLEAADPIEFTRFAYSRIDEAIHGGMLNKNQAFAIAIRDWFRQSIDDQVSKKTPKPKRPPSPTRPSTPKKLSKRVRGELIDLVNRYPHSPLIRIARYTLRLTLAGERAPDAGILIDRALDLKRFEAFISELILSAPDEDTRIELSTLFPGINAQKV